MRNKALVIIDIQNDITKNYKDIINNINKAIHCKLYPVKRTRERVAFKPTSPVYGR